MRPSVMVFCGAQVAGVPRVAAQQLVILKNKCLPATFGCKEPKDNLGVKLANAALWHPVLAGMTNGEKGVSCPAALRVCFGDVVKPTLVAHNATCGRQRPRFKFGDTRTRIRPRVCRMPS